MDAAGGTWPDEGRPFGRRLPEVGPDGTDRYVRSKGGWPPFRWEGSHGTRALAHPRPARGGRHPPATVGSTDRTLAERQAAPAWLRRLARPMGRHDVRPHPADHDPSDDGRGHRRAGRAARSGSATAGSPTGRRCNYLGFDLDEEIIATVPEYLAAWGTHPSWSRLLGNPSHVPRRSRNSSPSCVGTEDTLVLPTITHIHMSVIPVLVGDGTIFLDGRAHKTIYDGAMVAAGHGATVVRFRHNDYEHLEELLARQRPRACPRLIAMDGVNSMTGNAPDLAAFSRVAQRARRAALRRRRPRLRRDRRALADEACDYGTKGNGVFRHLDVPLRQRGAGGRVLQVLLLAAGVHRPAHPPEGRAQGAGAAVPVLGTVAGRLARHDAGRPGGEPDARRRLPRRPVAHDPPAARRRCTRSASTPRTPRDSRSSRSRSPTTRTSTRWAGTCSSTGSTPRWPPTRWCPRTRSGSGSRSPRPTPIEQIDELIAVLGNLHERFQLEPYVLPSATGGPKGRPRSPAAPSSVDLRLPAPPPARRA